MTTLMVFVSPLDAAPVPAAEALPAALGSRHRERVYVTFHERLLPRPRRDPGATCYVPAPATLDLCFSTGPVGDEDAQCLVSGPTDAHLTIDLDRRELAYSRQTAAGSGPGSTRRASFALGPADLEGVEIPDGSHLVRLADPARRRLWDLAQEAERRASAA